VPTKHQFKDIYDRKLYIIIFDRLNHRPRLESKENMNFFYFSIKPDNFTMGINSKCQNVYLIDFGLSKYYLNKRTHQHIKYNDNKHFLGTIRYASLRTHIGIEQSRRDDLESLAYTLIYLARRDKCLPWQGIKCKTKKEKQEKIYEIKLHTHIESLCLNLPKEFQEFLIYTRKLAFAEEPNYFYLFSLIKKIYQTMNIKNDFIYDWIIIPKPSPKQKKKILN
jgi:casein kinase I family protein HRR25